MRVKLILANNQTERFVSFYQNLRKQSGDAFEYASYEHLLFEYDSDAEEPLQVTQLQTNKSLKDYDGVYLNGYLSTYELAASTATCCQALDIPFVNQELANAPSLSKLTTYAKLGRANVRVPRTVAGAKKALSLASEQIGKLTFPLVLKRADADRGIDNYKVYNQTEIDTLLTPHDDRSLWILQEYVANNGFYLLSYYDQTLVFSIFRSLEARPDGDESKAHMYKPKGGANASLLELQDVPEAVRKAGLQAMQTMNRQIGSVDVIHDPATDKAYVLEVNYNPQLVTIETYKEVRIQAFLKGIQNI